jgi:fructose-bisphosphate aldolase class I
MSELNKIALEILNNGKGILAADESTGTMSKRLESVNVSSTPKNRLLFRETLFSSSSMKECIGGVILYDETIKQTSSKKNKIPDLILSSGSYPGIKVDTGAKILAGSPDEKITEGLDGLRERLKEYFDLGAKFTKWRGVYNIAENYPSKLSIQSNAHALARYSALVQECNMVPIVEPEVLMDGDHSAKDCYQKTSEVIKKCFDELISHKVDLKGIILKPNMILAGNKAKDKISGEEVAKLTLECLKNSVPTEVPGIAFLSGGQSEIEATENLNLINKINDTGFIMSYSYGRALQQSALKFWSKNIEDIKGTQKVFNHRAKMNTLAAQGKWSREIESE